MTTATASSTTPSTTSAPISPTEPTVPAQAGLILGQVAGYMAVRAVEMGLQSGLVQRLAEAPGAAAADLAEALDMDESYVGVWCRSLLAAGLLDRDGHGFRLAAHMGTLLLDEASPSYMGGMYPLIRQPEMFTRFAERLHSGERSWWDETGRDWIAGVAATGQPFYTRLIRGGLDQVPGLAERLAAGGRVADTACGAGAGVIRLANAYPNAHVVGVDGDQHSIDTATDAVRAAGLEDRVTLVRSPLEQMVLDAPVSAVINNISMHECRDIDEVTRRVYAVLEPGGWFVISDFPFPDNDDDLRSLPGRVMSGIQFFEAQIDDQLLPRSAYDGLLSRHGFTDLGWFSLNPMHAVTYGRRPA